MLPFIVSFGLMVGLGLGTAWCQDDSDSFPEPYDSEAETTTLPLEPEQAAATFRVPDGFTMTLFAAEPDVRQPIALASDEKGRLWVAENYTYAEHAKNFDEQLKDRIVILHDTDGDGRADVRKVFWDQAHKLTSLEIGVGGVWALCAPQLLFLPDRDGDDVMDGDPIVVLDGWDEGAVRHNIVNGLRWGPDGWLYGRHGILATSFVGSPGTPHEHRTPLNCAIWRYHPRRDQFEVVATGTTNPWGMDWDSEGELFFINTVIGHLWHAVPGSHFERMYGGDFNPHWYSLMPQIADHVHWNTDERWSDIRKEFTSETDHAGGGHAHVGLLIYQEDQWPKEYQGNVFTLNLHGRRLNRDRLQRQGSSFVATHAPDFAFSEDPWFRGIELISGPDGQVWIADWSDTGECHENDGVHRSSGRIFQLDFGGPGPNTMSLEGATLDDLTRLAAMGSEWQSRHARRLLVDAILERDEQDAERVASVGSLKRIVESELGTGLRLRSLWALYGMNEVSTSELLELLADANPAMRRWAVRLLADKAIDDQGVPTALATLAETETDGLVLTYLASSLQRIPVEERWQLATRLAQSELAKADHRLQQLIWFGIEPSVASDSFRAGGWLATKPPDDLVRWTARRLAVLQIDDPSALVSVLVDTYDLAASTTGEAFVDGLATGLKGAVRAHRPVEWKQWTDALPKERSPRTRLALAELELLFGEGRGAEFLISIAQDSQEDLAIRRQSMLSLGQSRTDDAKTLLLGFIQDRDLGDAALRALRFYSDPQVAKRIVDSFQNIRLDYQPAAVTTLCARPESAQVLLAAIEQGTISKERVSAYEWRQLLSLQNQDVQEKVLSIWPESREWQNLSAQKQRVTSVLTDTRLEQANLENGAELFQKNCANCHKLVGKGAEIGPDLTGSQRGNLTYLIDNIVSPSAEVATNYRTSLLEMSDGQVIVGVIIEQLPDRLVIQTKEGPLTLPRVDILDRQQSSNSLMPDGLLNPLTDEQVIDLFAYLQRIGRE